MKRFQCTLTLAMTAVLLASGADGMAATATNAPAASCCASSLRPGDFTDRSVYQVASQWTNDNGRVITLGELRGRPQVVVMFFASCNYACPILLNDLRRIEAALPETARGNVDFTLVSFDTRRDTPKALASFREGQNLPADRWRLLSGADDDILELAALLGVRYKQEANGQYMHSNLITILDAEGEVVHQQTGLNQDIGDTVRVLTKLATH